MKVSWQMIAGVVLSLLLSMTTWAASDAITRLAKVEERENIRALESIQMLYMLKEVRAAQERDHRLLIEIAKRNKIYVLPE